MHRLTPSSPEVSLVPINECHEPLVDLKQTADLQYGPPPECPATAPDYTRMREGIYKRMLKAQSLLPEGIYIRLYEGYRSLDVQQMLFNDELARVRQRQPDFADDELFEEATRMVSAVTFPDGSHNVPPHNTGAAVDLELVDSKGVALEFGMDIHRWTEVDPNLCFTMARGLSDEAVSNRKLLVDVMSAAGFVNYPQEWWHFSYGDKFWAFLAGFKEAIYGPVKNSG